MGIPPAVEGCVCLGRSVGRASRVVPPIRIAFQVRGGVQKSWVQTRDARLAPPRPAEKCSALRINGPDAMTTSAREIYINTNMYKL